MEILFESPVFWAYDYELEAKSGLSQIAAQFSGVPPIHEHSGALRLSTGTIEIVGDVDLLISLNDIEELYLGFDEVYHRNFVKNLGAFCQPLRIRSSNGFAKTTIYLIAGYSGSSCAPTQNLFNLLQQILS